MKRSFCITRSGNGQLIALACNYGTYTYRKPRFRETGDNVTGRYLAIIRSPLAREGIELTHPIMQPVTVLALTVEWGQHNSKVKKGYSSAGILEDCRNILKIRAELGRTKSHWVLVNNMNDAGLSCEAEIA
jgi:hypothetical protein